MSACLLMQLDVTVTSDVQNRFSILGQFQLGSGKNSDLVRNELCLVRF